MITTVLLASILIVCIFVIASLFVLKKKEVKEDAISEAVLVVYATQSGSAKKYAQQLASRLKRSVRLMDASSPVEPWDELLNGKARDCVAIVSTYEGGRVPENSRVVIEDQVDELVHDFRVGATALRGRRFAVLGLGSSAYADTRYCAAAKGLEKKLRKLGASRVATEMLDDQSHDTDKKFDLFAHRVTAAFTHPCKIKIIPQESQKNPQKKTHSNDDDDDDDDDEENDLVDVEDVGTSFAGSKQKTASSEPREMVTAKQAASLKKEGYKLIGTHSAVKMCRWTKHQLRGRGGCYKHTFYGITSYQCMEATPSLACANKCVFCIAEGTLVNLAQGISIPIEQCMNNHKVLALDDFGQQGLVSTAVTAVACNGTKPCVEILLNDGRTLVCTEDHRIRTINHTWVQAGQLSRGAQLAASVEFPKSSIRPKNNADWSLDVSASLGYKLDFRAEPIRSFAFARLAGWLFSGKFSWNASNRRVTIFLKHDLDVDAIEADLTSLTSDRAVITKEDILCKVELPRCVSEALTATCFTGCTQTDVISELPHFIRKNDCPLAVLKEFFGGFFGASAYIPTLSHMKEQVHLGGEFGFAIKRKGCGPLEKESRSSNDIFSMLAKFGLRTPNRALTELENGSYSIAWNFSSEEIALFAAEIGLRYAYHKQLQLSMAAVVARQHCVLKRQSKKSKRLENTWKLDESIENLKIGYESSNERSWPLYGVSVVNVSRVGPRRVYDLTVPRASAPDDGSFMANGIVVHNCWRHHKNPVGREWRWKTDPPDFIVEEAVQKHVAMINEAKGIPGVIEERWREAMTVRHCALSLVGEPIMYPHINQMLDELHARNISSFLVTNAQFPEAIRTLVPVTQLYVSVDAPNELDLERIDRPLFSDAWQRLGKSLDLLRAKRQRTVARLTIVKGYNADDIDGYADLLVRGVPTLVEIKGVTFCGKSDASDLTMESCPWHHEIVNLSDSLCKILNHKLKTSLNPEEKAISYGIACSHKHSVSVVLARADQLCDADGVWHTWIDYDKFHELVRSGKSFDVHDYRAPTPAWALHGAEEEGFDPSDTRLYKKKANGKSR